MGTQISNPPLLCKLTAIQFNPIEKMADFVSDIQEAFRKTGYSDFKPEDTQGIKIDPEKNNIQIQQINTVRWLFANAELTETFILEHNRLVFMTTDYKDMGAFVEKTLSGMSIINNTIDLDFVDRVGVRTIDVILPSKTHMPNDYLNGELDGFAMPEQASLIQKVAESVFSVGGGILVCRTFQSKEAITLPSGMRLEPLVTKEKFTTYEGPTGTIDLDHYVDERTDCELEIIKERIMHSHKITSDIFYQSISQIARDDWGVEK